MSIKEIESLEAPAAFASILRDVEEGDLYVVMREGRPIAEIRPVEYAPSDVGVRQRPGKEELLERFRRLREGNRLDGMTIKELRDEGRR